jgi:multiple sugar transport system permease protein
MAATQDVSIPQTQTRAKVGSLKAQRIVGKILALALLTLGSILVLMPLAWMVSTSLKTEDMASGFPPEWIPHDIVQVSIEGRQRFLYWVPIDGQMRQMAMMKKRPGEKAIFADPTNPSSTVELPLAGLKRVSKINFHWENYKKALIEQSPFLLYTKNTLIIVFTTTIGVLISCILVAYGFSRFRAPWIDLMFLLLLSTIMLPAQVTLIPTFVFFQKIGWYDTFLPLIVPAFFGNAWDVFLLRQFFMSVPIEMDEAAKIDGASPLGILYHILLPQAWPAVATVAIFHFLWAWNDFFGPLIYLQTQTKWTIAVGLQSFRALYSRNLTGMMAASTVTMLPCLLLFFLAQKLFIQGVVVSGIKG